MVSGPVQWSGKEGSCFFLAVFPTIITFWVLNIFTAAVQYIKVGLVFLKLSGLEQLSSSQILPVDQPWSETLKHFEVLNICTGKRVSSSAMGFPPFSSVCMPSPILLWRIGGKTRTGLRGTCGAAGRRWGEHSVAQGEVLLKHCPCHYVEYNTSCLSALWSGKWAHLHGLSLHLEVAPSCPLLSWESWSSHIPPWLASAAGTYAVTCGPPDVVSSG